MKSILTFHGGAGSVTGANFVLETGSRTIAVDCGLEQGSRETMKNNWKRFTFDPSKVDTLFITHAHLDHIGRVPKLVKDGFKGNIISTKQTMELASIMLDDAYNVMEFNSRRGGPEPMYHTNDIRTALSLWRGHDYYTPFSEGDMTVRFLDSGHVLGSSMVEFERGGKKMLFTGDLGNSPTPLLKDTDPVSNISYMVMESVYGDRNHEPKDERSKKLAKTIKMIIERGGTVLIPAFSLERTQVLLYEINNLIEDKVIPHVPVYFDSPLGRKVTVIYKNAEQLFNDNTKKEIAGGDDIFDFPGLVYVKSNQESEQVKHDPRPKIILAGSGMSEGGRILRHEADFLGDKRNGIILVGFQTPGTLGRAILDGEKILHINGEKVRVEATVASILGYSSHKDSDHLIEFVAQTAKSLETVFLAMGEYRASTFLAQRLKDYVGVKPVVPKPLSRFEIEF